MAKFGKEILRRYDGFGPVQVFDDGNKRTLMFGADDEQGCVLKHAPEVLQYAYVRAMLLAMIFCKNTDRCLLLGLGSGALANTLLHYFPQMHIDVVELRQTVIDVAHSHFYLPRSPRLNIVSEDAGEFVRHSQNTYDIIFSDIYHGNGMDAQQASPRFLDHCVARLSEQGWLILNYWQAHKTLDPLPMLSARFASLWSNNINHENWIIYAGRSNPELTDKIRKAEVRKLNNMLGFSLSKVAAGLAPIPD